MSTAPLREDDIRPQHLDADKEAAYARDLERLLAGRDRFVTVPCPACGEDEASLAWTKLTLSYQRCATCRTVYISPRPDQAAVAEYYATSELYEFWSKHIFPASEEARRERIVLPRLRRLLDIVDAHGVKPRTLVEVGAGYGTFLQEAADSGRFERVLGVEPTPSLAGSVAQRGIEVLASPIEEVDLAGRDVTVLAAFEVIEHLFEPLAFATACARVLEPGGLLVLTCPQVEGFEIQVLGEVADTIDGEHLNYFTLDGLRRLCERAGLELLDQTTPGELDADIVRNKVLAGRHTLADGFLQAVLIDRYEELGQQFQAFLASHRMSTHAWTVARRPTG